MIYIAHAFALPKLSAALEPWLTSEERSRAESYTSQARQLQYLVGRGLLRWLACEMRAIQADQVAIQRQNNGAPSLIIGNVEVACSISHKDDAVMVAFGEAKAMGIDIEVMKPRKRQLELIEAFSQGFMCGVVERDLNSFYQRWTLAESVTKARQGKLLTTLREPFAHYVDDALFHVDQEHMLCCYVAANKSEGLSSHRWLRVSSSDGLNIDAQVL